MWQIIKPAGEIPDGSTVRKITGEFEYTLREKVNIFGLSKEVKLIFEPSLRFLVNAVGVINAIPDTKELVWLVDEDFLRRHLNGLHDFDYK